MRQKHVRNAKGVAIAEAIVREYGVQTREEMDKAMKEVFGPIFEALLQGEMNSHLGYESNDHGAKRTENRRNGYIGKELKTTYGKIPINVPRDREASFEPQIIPKRTRDVSGIENKILSMYARGMSQRDIADTVEEMYGFNISHETISKITDKVMEQVTEWQNRPLKRLYSFMFVDCMYVTIKKDYETKNYALYTILGYDENGMKDILGMWLNERESKHIWMQIFDELKGRGVEDVLFISMDGVSGLEEGAKAIFPNVIVQRCIVHLIRNSMKYIPSKDYKAFTSNLRKLYGSSNLKAAEFEFERFKQTWKAYPGAIDVWEKNWKHVEQLFNYGSAVRKIMYTTNAVESVHASFRKVTKKGSFPNEIALFKLIFLRITELYRKWSDRPVPNWATVKNQLFINENLRMRISIYENS